MFFSDQVTLRKVAVTNDSYGDVVKSYTDTVVFADVKSVTRSEFYAANASGIKISQVFAVHVEDWNDQTELIYGSKYYDIVRAYRKGEGVVELTCNVREVG